MPAVAPQRIAGRMVTMAAGVMNPAASTEPVIEKEAYRSGTYRSLLRLLEAAGAKSEAAPRNLRRFRRVSVSLDRSSSDSASAIIVSEGSRRLVLGCIKASFASKDAFESSRRDLHNVLLCTALKESFFVTMLTKKIEIRLIRATFHFLQND